MHINAKSNTTYLQPMIYLASNDIKFYYIDWRSHISLFSTSQRKMVKAYLRYELANSWGVITSKSGVWYDRFGKYFFTASLECVSVWDVKQAVLVSAPEQT